MTQNGNGSKPDRTFEARSGVVFSLRPPNLAAMSKRMVLLLREQPRPPMYFNEAKGREEPNDNDPTYLQEVMEFYAREKEVVYDVMLTTGTRVESVPDDLMQHDSDDFQEYMEGLGLALAKNRHERYCQWCKYLATDVDEWKDIIGRLLEISGVSEEMVAQMGVLFPGIQGWQPVAADTSTGGGVNGDSPRADGAGGGAAIRADGDGDSVQHDAEPVDGPGVVGAGAAGGVHQDSQAG